MIVTYRRKLKELSQRHGVPFAKTVVIFRNLQEKGATPYQALQAIKCGYAMTSGIEEYFTAEDIAAVLVIPETEAEQKMQECPDCMQVTYPDWLMR